MIIKLPLFKGLHIRIPIIIPIKGRGLLIRGLHEGVEFRILGLRLRLRV